MLAVMYVSRPGLVKPETFCRCSTCLGLVIEKVLDICLGS